MRLNPLFTDPLAVLVSHQPVPAQPASKDFQQAGQQVLAALGLELDGENLVVKPNVTSGEHFADPDTGITTHPEFVRGLLAYGRDHGAKRGGLYVLEDPRDSNDNNPRHWLKTGFCELRDELGAQLRCPTSFTVVKRTVPHPLVHKFRRVSRLAVAPNTVLINCPKMKTHNLGITSLGMKNLMGVDNVWDRHYCSQSWGDLPPELRHDDRPKEEWMDRALHELWQEGLGKRLADLASVVRPALTVVEGVIARDGTGFNNGRNFPLGLAIAGTNVVAVDAVTSYIMGFDPQKLVYLRVAAEAGLGENDMSRLHVYTVADGAVVPCRDLAALRSPTPFVPISGILNEDPESYR